MAQSQERREEPQSVKTRRRKPAFPRASVRARAVQACASGGRTRSRASRKEAREPPTEPPPGRTRALVLAPRAGSARGDYPLNQRVVHARLCRRARGRRGRRARSGRNCAAGAPSTRWTDSQPRAASRSFLDPAQTPSSRRRIDGSGGRGESAPGNPESTGSGCRESTGQTSRRRPAQSCSCSAFPPTSPRVQRCPRQPEASAQVPAPGRPPWHRSVRSPAQLAAVARGAQSTGALRVVQLRRVSRTSVKR